MDLAVNSMVMKVILLTVSVVLIAVLILIQPLPSSNTSDPKTPAKTRNCVFWLINVLFLDKMSPKFKQLGGKKDKNMLDSGLAANDQYFWQEVADKYQETND